MHNLHFILVRASSGEKACQDAENQIIDFGTDNNWRTMCGAVSEDNEVYDAGDGRYRPHETEYTTIEQINQAVKGWLSESFYGATAKEKLGKGETNLDEWNAVELWSLSRYAKHLSEAHSYKDREFDILKEDVFYAYEYEECGVTNLCYNSEDDGQKIWIVFVDMHS
jgi:hypothetical protein